MDPDYVNHPLHGIRYSEGSTRRMHRSKHASHSTHGSRSTHASRPSHASSHASRRRSHRSTDMPSTRSVAKVFSTIMATIAVVYISTMIARAHPETASAVKKFLKSHHIIPVDWFNSESNKMNRQILALKAEDMALKALKTLEKEKLKLQSQRERAETMEKYRELSKKIGGKVAWAAWEYMKPKGDWGKFVKQTLLQKYIIGGLTRILGYVWTKSSKGAKTLAAKVAAKP